MVSTFAGSFDQGHVDAQGGAARFDFPAFITIDKENNLYVSDRYYIRKITPEGIVTTLAGAATNGSVNGADAAARFDNITAMTADKQGNVYVIDNGLEAGDGLNIRKIIPAGVVSIFKEITEMAGVLIADDQGNLYAGCADFYAFIKYAPTGEKTIIKGLGTGESVYGMARDAQGNFFYTVGAAPSYNANRIYKLSPSGEITTVAGTGEAGYKDGEGTVAQFYNPSRVAVDKQGNVYVDDGGNNRIRKISKQ